MENVNAILLAFAAKINHDSPDKILLLEQFYVYRIAWLKFEL